MSTPGEEFLEFEARLSGTSFDLAKERVGDFERGAHGSILAQKRTGLKPECPRAMKAVEEGWAGWLSQNTRHGTAK